MYAIIYADYCEVANIRCFILINVLNKKPGLKKLL